MSGDYTRFTFKPIKRFAGVQMQQGKVQLDADWNEQVAIERERTRLLSLDVGGTAWLPELTTPDAFLIALAGAGDLSIAPGRIYVEGRVAEVFADEGVTYLQQPFLPAPPLFNNAIDTIVYLDLWEREVTWAEDVELLDVALGGVDTATRVQQVWQVKLYEQRGVPAACGVDLDALFPASAGRLSTSAVAPPPPDDPCILPPKSGYRGIENRCYRVEIHQAGPLGSALFKWSRDDASIVNRVKAMAVSGSASLLTVDRLGRDDQLRLRIDDWVTVTDDHRDLHGEAGEMARIIDIDEAARIVTLDRVIPVAGRPFATAPADIGDRNTRIQRWDQRAPLNTVNADGLMATAAGPIDLEDGIQLAFSTATAGGEFNVGDYWIFAARTADASVEILQDAAPRGIDHQYLQLAAIPAGGAAQDCRPKPSSKGCCTIVVPPGLNRIQDAIDKLPKEGGCVCLKVGEHLIDQPIVIDRSNITLHGECLGAIVYNRRGSGLLQILGAQQIRVMDIWFRQGEAAQEPVLFIGKSQDVIIDDCRIENFGRGPESIGLRAALVRQLAVTRCQFGHPVTGVKLEGGCEDITVAECSFELAGLQSHVPTNVAILADRMVGPLVAEGNVITAAFNGILVRDVNQPVPVSRARQSRISGNRLTLEKPRTQDRCYGIDVAAEAAIILSNHVLHKGGPVTGIRMCGNGSTASQNIIETQVEIVGPEVGIGAGFRDGTLVKPVERLTISDNIVSGSQHGIVMVDVAHVEVRGNCLGRSGMNFGIGVGLGNCEDCLVIGNSILRAQTGILTIAGARNRIEGNSINDGQLGIGVGKQGAPVISGNSIHGTAHAAISLDGILNSCDIGWNQIANCGWQLPVAVSIAAIRVYGDCRIAGNDVQDTGLPPDPTVNPAALAVGILGLGLRDAEIDGNRVGYSYVEARKPTFEDRALLLLGNNAGSLLIGGQALPISNSVQITNNRFTGVGAKALVEIQRLAMGGGFMHFDRVMFSGNHCYHWTGPPNPQAATVWLVGRACTLSGNQVVATTRPFASYNLNQMIGPFQGNVSSGGVLDRPQGGGFPTPQANFNLIV